jgi:hypothetical protein
MKQFETIKVYDVTEMPEDIQKLVYDKFRGTQNDVYVAMYVLGELKPIELVNPDECCYLNKLNLESYNGNEIYKEEILSGVKYIMERGDDPISDWIHDNGAKICEKVIIKYWW